MTKITQFIRSRPYDVVAFVLIIIALCLRLIDFPNLPPGFNQDELSSLYESYSIATEGTDRWGNHLPPYFPSWGSGQNVLQAYLSIPFVMIFGISLIASRLPYLIAGILLGIFVYLSVSKAFNKNVGIVAMIFTLFQPWHFMMFRWGLESNLLPVVFMAGVYSLQLAIKSKYQKHIIPFALIPMGLSLYAYGISLFTVPIFLVLFFTTNIAGIWKDKRLWLVSISLFVLISTPLLLFILKNNVLKHDLPFENILPFSLPALPVSRLDQINSDNVNIFEENKKLLLDGMYDGLIWNSIRDYPPYIPNLLKLSLSGMLLYLVIKRKNLKSIIKNPYIHYLIALMPILIIVPLNVNRGNLFFVVIMTFGAYASIGWIGLIKFKYFKYLIFIVLAVYISLSFKNFLNYYFNKYENDAANSFNKDFDKAFSKLKEDADDNQRIYISSHISINYLFPIGTLKVPSSEFRSKSDITFEDGAYHVAYYDRYFFDINSLHEKTSSGEEIILLLKGDEDVKEMICDITTYQEYRFDNLWRIANCNVK